jgi:hypothetical protein
MNKKMLPHGITAGVLVVFIVLGLASGATTPSPYEPIVLSGNYIVTLSEVERPENAQERWGNSQISTFEDDGTSKSSFEDDMIKIIWFVLPGEFSFVLQNKTNNSIRIIWDEAVYVNENGFSGKVAHSDISYTEMNNSQPSTVVVKNTSVDDIIVPTKNIYYSSYSGWNIEPLFREYASTQEELDETVKEKLGETVKILLPLQIEETVNEYMFSFKIENFIQD